MQVQLETFLHKQWDRKGLISWLLLPASAVFLSMAASRRRKTVPVKVGVPVVVVGNIYVGGTGKNSGHHRFSQRSERTRLESRCYLPRLPRQSRVSG